MRWIVRRFVVILACLTGLPACATLTTDDHQAIAIRSDPLGATCLVQQGGNAIETIGRTPGTAYVAKGRHDLEINCTLPGYFPGAAVLESHFQDMTYGNLLVGGPLGLLVDTSSGAIKEYPHTVIVLLDRQPVPGETQAQRDEMARDTEMRRNAMRRGSTY
jgi:hypothetical protein